MKKLIVVSLVSISSLAAAGGLTDGQAALLGIAIGAGIRNSVEQPVDQRYIYRRPVPMEYVPVVPQRRYPVPEVYYQTPPTVTYYYDAYGRLVQQIHTPVPVAPAYRIVE